MFIADHIVLILGILAAVCFALAAVTRKKGDIKRNGKSDGR